VSTSAAPLEWLLSPAAIDTGPDRKVLAGLLLELARNVDANVGVEPTGIVPFDPRLEELRTLLLGREIELSRHLSQVLDDPEQLAIAVSRVLPAAIAQAAARDERLGQVLAPALGSSVRRDPDTLVDILHPLIGPAIGKSIDATFQSLNESLKYSLSWRGLRWRWEAWRTGTSFAEVVLKHTLVYRVEHVFLIHRHSGLLIAHAASQDATSQDPQLVSSMLAAIQDFVRDSFAEQHGLDALRLGELRVWSEPGPFATLVAVIRGNPPEELHETFRGVLARIHAERREALETFDGDSSGFADVEAALTDCVQLKQEAARPAQKGFAWLLIAAVGLALLGLAGTWGYQRWHDGRLWGNFLERLRAEPGIVITETGKRDDKWLVGGLRDPLAVDPQLVLREASIDPARVVSHWQPYQSLDPEFVLKRVQIAFAPPPTVSFVVEDGRIVAAGTAPFTWIQRARASSRMLPAGGPPVDLSQVRDLNEGVLGKVREAIQSKEIRFDYNNSLPAPGQEAVLDQLAAELKELRALSSSLQVTTRVTLTGHADLTGKGLYNLSLSLGRAESVRTLLKQRGVDPDLLAVRSAGTLEPRQRGDSEAARSVNRRVSFTVGIDE
jgi:outer membrane protein OmpA-like peptidoglycan-associated protein